MANQIIEQESYEDAQRRAKGFYFKIGRVWCPLLNDYIRFGGAGWRHIIRKRGVFRPKSEQKRRFALLDDAANLIEDSTTEVIYSEKALKFWKLIGRRPDCIIKVVIRQFEGGEKHFLSVYEK